MVKELAMKQIVAAELNHHNTPIEIREAFALEEGDYREALHTLHGKEEIEEVFIIATCNRLAIYAYATDITPVRSFFDGFPDIHNYLTLFTQTDEAVSHLFATSAGLESQALGEHQILGQIRSAFAKVHQEGTIGPVLNELLRRTIRVGKRVRGETEIGRFPTSLASVALRTINQNIKDYPRQRVLILGTGEMATLTAKLLSKSGFNQMAVASQSPERAQEFARDYGINTETYDHLADQLVNYDIVIGATAAQKPLFDVSLFSDKGVVNNLMLIDLGIPRNFDGGLRDLTNIQLYDLDDIKDRTQKSLEERKKEVPKAREIIGEELQKFNYWFNSRSVSHLIEQLYDQVEDLKEEEYQWALNKLKEPDANYEWILQRLLHRMVRKFLKNPVERVKDYAQHENQLKQPDQVFEELFDLKQTHFHVPRKKIVLGSRGSKLAMIQANNVVNLLKQYAPDYEFEVRKIKTSGDSGDLTPIGAFCKEIDNSLVNKEIDMAVHCLKDMPTGLPEGLKIGAVLERDDPRDAFLSADNRKIEELPPGAVVGTSSLRRSIQIKSLRPDVYVKPLRGNVNTRIKKMKDGHFDAIVLGGAGLQRMGLLDEVTELLSPDKMVPCVGQGVIALEIREFDWQLHDLLRFVDHQPSRIASLAEREYLMELGGGCNMPIGAYGSISNDELHLQGLLGTDDGSIIKRDDIKGHIDDYQALGKKLAQKLTSELETHSA